MATRQTMSGGAGRVCAARRSLFPPALIAELDGDLIRHSRESYDVATLLGQLGLPDMGEAAAEATPTS